MAVTEIVSDSTRRVFWLASYGVNTLLTPLNGTTPSLYIGAGTVSIGGVQYPWAGGYIIPLNQQYQGRGVSSGSLVLAFQANATHNVYVDGTTGQITLQVVSPGAAFPVGSLPLYVVTTDAAFRFYQVQDVRPSTLGMRNSMDSVADNTKRISYGNNFSFSQVTAPGSSAYTMQLASGQVLVSGNVMTPWWGGWLPMEPTLSDGVPPNAGAYLPGSTLQGYVDTLGVFQLRQVEYPAGVLHFGVTSVTSFPLGCLPLFVIHLDGVGRIYTVDDYRPA